MINLNKKGHSFAVFTAFFVTMLWSSSWVLIKIGLNDISPLIFAGIRYFIASIILFSLTLKSKDRRTEMMNLDKSMLGKLMVYGLFYYTITQGAQFIGLLYLQAITVSFMLNLTTIVVLLLAIPIIKELPSKNQLILVAIGLLGVVLFFYPIDLPLDQKFGLFIMSIGVLANSLSSIFGRSINRARDNSPLVITTLSMTFGSLLLMIIAIIIEGIPQITFKVFVIIIWLAVINTALAFVLWNRSLQELQAVESSIINSTMLPQITILAIIFFDESLVLKEWIGLVLIFVTGLLISVIKKQK